MRTRLAISVDYKTIGLIDLGRKASITKPYTEYWCNRFYGDFNEVIILCQTDNNQASRVIDEFSVEEIGKQKIILHLTKPLKVSTGPHFWWDSFRELHKDLWDSDNIVESLNQFSAWMGKDEGVYLANRHGIAVLFCDKYQNLFKDVSKETIFKAFWAFRSHQPEFYINRCFVEDKDFKLKLETGE